MKKFVTKVVNAVLGFVSKVVDIITGHSHRNWHWQQVSDPAAPSNGDIDDLIKTYMQQHSVKAGQFSLFVNRLLTVSSAYTWGESDYPVTQIDSVMRVASCSKAFTTAAILDLLAPASGDTPTLRFDDKVFDILFPNDPPIPVDSRVKDITVQHLLEHTGGWNYHDGPNAVSDWVFHLKHIGRHFDLHSPPEKKDFARFVLCDIHLDFSPGTRPTELFHPSHQMNTYSNIGYVLLGMIVDEKSTTYLDHLTTNILSPMSITDVAVGKTREADLLANETRYESEGFGPDATIDPFNPRTTRLPYGGDGSRKELMDSGGGLIMSANSLAKFITQNNVYLDTLLIDNIASQKGRNNKRREGSMPGTQAMADSFLGKDESKFYDMAVIFNRQDVSKTALGDDRTDFQTLVDHLEDKIKELF